MQTGMIDLLRTDFLAFVIVAASIIEAIALHEFAHAYVADLQGDRLPRAMGRLSLNPVRHLDPLGTIFLVLVGFGWGKPVEFRLNALSSKRFGAALVALAGPGMNLLLAVLGAIVARIAGAELLEFGGDSQIVVPEGLTGHIARGFVVFSSINVILAVFNLI
ncbi:MAG: site-2 protease family protein, partial [Actinomycetota bacterium]